MPDEPPAKPGPSRREIEAFWASLWPKILLTAVKLGVKQDAEDVAQAAVRRVLVAGTWDFHDKTTTLLAVGAAVRSIASHTRRKKRRGEVLETGQAPSDEGDDGDPDERAGRMDGAVARDPSAEDNVLAMAKRERALRIGAQAHTELAASDKLGHDILDLVFERGIVEAGDQAEILGVDVGDVYTAHKRVNRALDKARERVPPSEPTGTAALRGGAGGPGDAKQRPPPRRTP